MTELANQIQAFTLTLLLGLITGGIFHYYQLFIRNAKVGRYSLYIMDFFLWILIITLVFWAMIYINQGEIRFYVLIAMLMGILIYFRVLSSRFDGLLSKTARRNVKAFTYLSGRIHQVLSGTKAFLKRLVKKPVSPPPPDDWDQF